MINAKDQQCVYAYMDKLDIEEMEFYEELYDHIVSSFENRKEKEQSMEQHLKMEVDAAFGGEEGIHKMIDDQRQVRKKAFIRHCLQVMASYFLDMRYVPIAAATGLSLIALSAFFDPVTIMNIAVLFGFAVPGLVMKWGEYKFKRSCKKAGRPYRESHVNSVLYLFSISVVALVQGLPDVLGRIFYGTRFNFMDLIEPYPYLYIPIGTLAVLYSLTCFRLFQEKFKVKLPVHLAH